MSFKNPSIENLVDLSEKWSVKFELSLGNLIQVKKALFNHGITMKEYVSFLSYMMEHYQTYKHVFDLVVYEIELLKEESKLKNLEMFKNSKTNIYEILKSSNAFKNREENVIIKKKEEQQADDRKEEISTYQEEYSEYLDLLKKYSDEESQEDSGEL